MDPIIQRLPLRHLVLSPQFWLRPLLVVGVLLASLAVAYSPSRTLSLLLLLALVGVCLSAIVVRWPPLGLIAAAIAGLVVPYLGPSGLNATALLIALLLGLWLMDLAARRQFARLAVSRPLWPALGYLVIALLSFGVGLLPWFNFAVHAPLGAQLGGLAIIVLSIGTFLLAANLIQDAAWLQRLTWAFLVVAALSILFRFVLPALGIAIRTTFQPVGSAFYSWLIALAAGQAIFNRNLRPIWRALLVLLVLVTLYALLVHKFADKSGWVPVLICLAVLACFRSWRVALLALPLGLVVVLFLLRSDLNSEEYSISTRLDAWLIMGQIIKVNPLWGLGFANYYWYTPLFAIRGYAVSFNSHNNYVDIVAQTGLIGLVFYLLILFEVGWLAWRLRERVAAGFQQAYVYSVLAGLSSIVVAGMLGDWVLPFFYNIGLDGFRTSMLTWLFFGGLVALEQWTPPQGAAS